MRVADFFCGSGGFSEGFRQAGFDIRFAVDKWLPAVETYKANKPDVKKIVLDDVIRISKLPNDEFEKFVPDTEIIIGSPPCIAFSNSNKSGKGDKKIGKELIEAYLRIIARKWFKEDKVLEYWMLENVPNAEAHIKKEYTAKDLGLPGNDILIVKGDSSGVYNAKNFGAPTNRKRYICGNFPAPQETCAEEDAITLGMVLKSLKKPKKGGSIIDCNYPLKMKYDDVTDHNYKYILSDFEWRTAKRLKEDRGYMGKMSFPENLNKPSRTVMATMSCSSRESMILAAGPGKYRLPTVREAASMMSFPIDYRFYGKTKGTKYTLVGNAVPPKLSYALAKAILNEKNKMLSEEYVQIKHDPSIEFHNLNNENIPSKKEKRKRDIAKFKYHLPYMIVSAYRVELTNYYSDFENRNFIWNAEIHYSQGKNAKAYPPPPLDIPLNNDIEEKIENFVESIGGSLVSFNGFQELYCMTREERGDKIGPYEMLESVLSFVKECTKSKKAPVTIKVKGIEKSLPYKIAVGYEVLSRILNEMKTKNPETL